MDDEEHSVESNINDLELETSARSMMALLTGEEDTDNWTKLKI